MVSYNIREIKEQDSYWIKDLVKRYWGVPSVILHGVEYFPETQQGFVAERDDEPVGFITFDIRGDACEIVALVGEPQYHGIGTALLDAMKVVAKSKGIFWLWLIVTNDNVDALRFFQRRGFVLSTINKRALDMARNRRPELPTVGRYGIPLRDEIELEMALE